MAKDVAISYLSIVMSFDWFRMITRECCEIYTLWDIYIYITLRWKLQAWSNVKLADYVSKFLLPLFLLKTNKVRNQEKLQKFAHVAHFGFSSQKNIFHHHHHQERKWRKCDKCWLYIIFCDCTWGVWHFFSCLSWLSRVCFICLLSPAARCRENPLALCRFCSSGSVTFWHATGRHCWLHFHCHSMSSVAIWFCIICKHRMCVRNICDFDPPPIRWH